MRSVESDAHLGNTTADFIGKFFAPVALAFNAKAPATARKALAQLFEDASQRQFDLVLFWSLDRFSREGMARTIAHLQRLDAAGVCESLS